MKLWPRTRGSVALLFLLLAAVCLLSLSGVRRVEADGSFISAPGRVDMVYDLKRDTLYISYRIASNSVITDSGILRFHVGSNSFLSPIPIYGNLMGVDLSPDGDTLLVADTLYSNDKIWVHQVDLPTLTVTKAEVARDWTYEGGTFAVAFANDGAALVTSTFLGSGWTPLRRYNPKTGVWTRLQDVRQNTMVSASPDRSMIAFAEANISDGRWGTYRVLNGQLVSRQWYEDGTSWFNYEIGAANGGSQYAIPTYGGTHIYNSAYAKTNLVGTYAAAQPIGVAYHPFDNIVYFAWANWSSNGYSPWVRGHRTTDFGVVSQFDFQNHFDHPGNAAFVEGRLRIAPDGSYLFGTVQNGVRFVQLGAHRPVATSLTAHTLEDAPVSVSLIGYSQTGTRTYEVVDSPGLGSLSGNAPDLVYTPPANVNGTDGFTYRVHDGRGYSNLATVQVELVPVNDAPGFVKGPNQAVPVGAPAQTVPGWATQISAGPADESGQTLTFLVNNNNPNMFAVQPRIAADGALTYTPASSAPAITATVTVHLKDSGGVGNGGADTSAPQTFTITFQATGQPPTAVDDSVETAEDTAVDLDVLANDTDPEGGALTLASVQPAANGAVQIVAGKARYTPSTNFHGSDSFSYVVRDASGLTDTGTVQVTVTPVNDAPIAEAQSVSVAEDTPKAVTLTGADADGDALTFTVLTGPAHGGLTGTPPNLTYAPGGNYSGADSFTFKVSDGQTDSAPATVSITVTAVNDSPEAADDTAATSEDTFVEINVLANDSDPDGDTLSISAASGASHGGLQFNAGKVWYFPARDFHGTDSFTYAIKDPSGATDTATVRVTVTPVNDAPIARGFSTSTQEDTPRSLQLSAIDPDGDPLTYAVTAPAHGTLSGVAPGLSYTPHANYHGPDSFTFTASDGQATSATATVSITVNAVNDPPQAAADTASTAEDASVLVDALANDSDVDGDALTLVSAAAGANGSVELSEGKIRYTPSADFHGSDAFTYTIRDPAGLTASGTVQVTVTAVNDPPTAVSQNVTTAEDTSAAVTLAGADKEGAPLTFAVQTGPAHGTLSGAPPNLTYTPALNYHGADSFTFTVSDGAATSGPATVTIAVTPVNDAPVAVGDASTTEKNTEVVIRVLSNDMDPDGDPLSVTGASAPANGVVTVNADGTIRYKPNKRYTGADSFTYTVNDGKGGVSTATVTVQVGSNGGNGNGNGGGGGGKGNNKP
jgi:hypothetical protein